MSVTPYSGYGWWVSPENFGNAYASSAFTCGPAPSAAVYIPASTCTAQPGKYPVSAQISFRGDPYSLIGLQSSDMFIARECGSTLCTYSTTPTWCSSSGGTLASGNNSFCLIKHQPYSGETGTQTYTANWTPNEPGIYYAVINARSTNPDLFLCTGNPLCPISDSPLTKLASTACTDMRFTGCQDGKMGEPADPNNGELWGESIRFEVVAAASCTPKPICGRVLKENVTPAVGIPYVPVRIISGLQTRDLVTTSDGKFSAAGFYDGLPYSVLLPGNLAVPKTAPPGYYPPGRTNIYQESYTSQVVGSYEDCALDCGCTFTYRSCDVISPIARDQLNTEIRFEHDGPDGFVPKDVSWKQDPNAGGVATSFVITVKATNFTGAAITVNSTVSGFSRVADPNNYYKVTLDSSTLKQLFSQLETYPGTITISVTGSRTADPACTTAATYTANIPYDTTEKVTLRVFESATPNICSSGTTLSDANLAGGKMSATWDGGGTYSGIENEYSKVLITLPHADLNADFKFTDDTYDCNTDATTCSNRLRIFDVLTRLKTCSTRNTQKAEADGNLTLYVSRLNIKSWWEAVGGIIYGNNTIVSQLPVDADSKPYLCPWVIGNTYDKKCSPYLVRSPKSEADIFSGLPLSSSPFSSAIANWSSERLQVLGVDQKLNQSVKIIPSLTPTESLYDSLKNLVTSKVELNTSLASTITTALPGSSGFYQLTVDVSGNHRLQPAATLPVGTNKYVFFVPGNLIITGKDDATLQKLTSVTSGGFIAFIVSGTIDISSNVGSDVDITLVNKDDGVGQVVPLVANLTGIFISDGKISIKSNAHSTTHDRRFIGEGSFISKSDVVMERTYGRESVNSKLLSGFTPTELFRHSPTLVLATPTELKEATIQYQEIQ